MHLFNKIFSTIIGLCIFSFNAQADAVYDLNNVVTNSQRLSIANELVTSSILVAYINEVYVKRVTLNGSYTLSFSGYLQNVDLNNMSINLTGFSSDNENLIISLSAVFPNGYCTNPYITYVSATGSSGIMHTAITQYMSGQSTQFLKNVMNHSQLSRYCRK